jgi:hypothetical protein
MIPTSWASPISPAFILSGHFVFTTLFNSVILEESIKFLSSIISEEALKDTPLGRSVCGRRLTAYWHLRT